MEKHDLILLHPPSIFDFRDRDDILFAFSSSSSISVSPVYEMYPLGFKAIETFLKNNGKKVIIINLADMMLNNPELDVKPFLKTLNTRMFGIDLHWLAHTQGSLAVASMLKDCHPDIPIVFGGISASHFYNELIEYPQVDFVIRGVDTPLLILKLLNELDKSSYHDIPNLCWKDKDKNILINDFTNAIEYNSAVDWVYSNNDINYFMVFSGVGCEYNCTFCSGSNYSMNKYMGVNNGFVCKDEPLFLNEMKSIEKHSSINTTLITLHHWFEDISLLKKVLDTFKSDKIRTIHFTLFGLLPKDHLQLISKYHLRPFFEISIQSSSEKIRELCGNPPYSNKELETWLDWLFAQNNKAIVAIFFMIGLPSQNAENVMEDVDYADYLMEKYQKYDLNVFISPMRPFLDPGSIIYDNPDKFGYTILFNTLGDYEKALLVPHWKDSLNYETNWLSKKAIVDITYKATRKMVLNKRKNNRLPRRNAQLTIEKIDYTVDLLDRIERYIDSGLPESLRNEIKEYNNEMLKSRNSQQSPLNTKIYRYWYE